MRKFLILLLLLMVCQTAVAEEPRIYVCDRTLEDYSEGKRLQQRYELILYSDRAGLAELGDRIEYLSRASESSDDGRPRYISKNSSSEMELVVDPIMLKASEWGGARVRAKSADGDRWTREAFYRCTKS